MYHVSHVLDDVTKRFVTNLFLVLMLIVLLMNCNVFERKPSVLVITLVFFLATMSINVTTLTMSPHPGRLDVIRKINTRVFRKQDR